MSPLTTKDLKRIFEKLDKNGDGHVSLDELSWLLERIGVQFSLTELESLVGKPSLNFDEFLFFYESISSPRHSNNKGDDQEDGINDIEEVDDEDELSDLVKAFKVFDQNDDGFISCEELQTVLIRLGLMEENSGKECKTMINAFDSNLDGQLDFEEFKNMMLLTRS
ncbi:Parvalbumin [Parasponia andersonii]|uniref:Parvalbumin n=1 Tax=Parasponia andersonii TaxID=3476 RepID=A0A2P5CGI3_PARAD|nr:Parvalbumin [Parasponia andersonii]